MSLEKDKPAEESAEPQLNTQSKLFASIAVLCIIGLILFIIFGLKGEPPKPPTVTHNYFTFTQIENLWQTEVEVNNQLFAATFRYHPQQTENVTVIGNQTKLRQPIYITFDPESNPDQFKYLALASTELSLHLIRGLNLTIEAACTKNTTDACINRTIIDCPSNASVIKFIAEEPTQVTLEDHCITLSGKELELLKSVDRLLFRFYRIT
ncbi:hypothetical protein C4580_03960 [Candidatus Woesearchaeota archaeon]|nr:MAG: hypothetical protein C4580_03960 [Candidatus Woesearchaeota archaeon]